MSAAELKGQCLCGAVAVTATHVGNSVGACHCDMCRRWSSGPFMAVDCGRDVSITGEESITVYDSSAWAERGFCKTCGSNLFYRLKESGQHIFAAGVFESTPELTFDHQVFIDEKPPYYSFAEKTSDMTGAEVFAKYAP